MRAASAGATESLAELVRGGADMELKDEVAPPSARSTWAVRRDLRPRATFDEPRARAQDDCTALAHAVIQNRTEAAAELVRLGADYDAIFYVRAPAALANMPRHAC
jgi:hypothetical protein